MNEIFKNKSLRILIFVFTVFFISRLGLYFVSYLGYNLFSKYTSIPSYTQMSEHGDYRMNIPGGISGTTFPTLKSFIKFDSDYYLRIAQNGYNKYKMSEPHPPADWPFFPLYPLLIALVHIKFPFDIASIGYFLSNLFAVLGLYFLYRITDELTGDENITKKTIFYILIYPASIYFSIIYTESLFLFLSTASVYMLMKRKISWSIFFASLSTVARVPGFVNLLLIAWVLFKESGYKPGKIRLRYYISMVISCIPMLMYLTYMYFLTGDFLAPFHELPLNWGRTASMPFAAYFIYPFAPSFISAGGWDLSIAGFIMTSFVFVVYIVCTVKRKINYELIAYGLALVLIPLVSASTTFTSMVRYYMVSFPLFIILAMFSKKSQVADFCVTTFFIFLNAIYTIGYINNYFFVV